MYFLNFENVCPVRWVSLRRQPAQTADGAWLVVNWVKLTVKAGCTVRHGFHSFHLFFKKSLNRFRWTGRQLNWIQLTGWQVGDKRADSGPDRVGRAGTLSLNGARSTDTGTPRWADWFSPEFKVGVYSIVTKRRLIRVPRQIIFGTERLIKLIQIHLMVSCREICM